MKLQTPQVAELAAMLAMRERAGDPPHAALAWRIEAIARDAATLCALARRIQRRAEGRCNYPVDEVTGARWDKADDRDYNKALMIVRLYRGALAPQGDVRGPAFRIVWPDGYPGPSNSSYEPGWCVMGNAK